MKLNGMKSIILGMIVSFCFQHNSAGNPAPQSDYDEEWQNVYELEKKGKPRSAIDIVDNIYAMASEENNQPQMLKSLEYGIRLSSRFQEDHFQKGIDHIRQEMKNFSEPSTQILHSLLADLYTGYYSANRHLILQRTSVIDHELNDMSVWDQRLFAQKIFDELNRSLLNPDLLKKTAASEYKDILSEGDSLDTFRPSLYDILAHHALDFYRNDEFMSSRPAVRFEIDDPQMIDIAEAFVKLETEQVEEFSMKQHALELYRELIAFHLNDKDPAALVDVDLARLNFVFEHAIFEEKEKLLRHTLEQMEAKYMGHEAVTEIYYQLALYYDRQGNHYQPLLSEDHKRDKLVAAQYCENAIREFPDSYGAKLCRVLLQKLNEKSLDCQLSFANLPEKHILASLGFKNVSEIFLRVVMLDPEKEHKERSSHGNDIKLQEYRKLRPVKQWSATLPVDIGLNNHRTEVAIPPLTEGYYGLLISDDPSFEKSRGIISINNFWVTDLSYISNEKKDGDMQFYILSRKSGEALPGVEAIIYEEFWDNRSRQQQITELDRKTSDENGAFTIEAAAGKSRRIVLELLKGVDRFISPNYFYVSSSYDKTEKPVQKTHFFTDRAIYRPGQTVYFKGILIESSGAEYEIVKDEKTRVRFYDANNQLISELDLQTNEYGSFNGSFIAPAGRLTGKMRLQNETGSVYVSVEEYKRPDFEIVFDPVKGSYRLDSEVSITGKAMAYAGNTIDNATVKYRVVRNAYYPYRYHWHGYYPQTTEAEIAFGETLTEDDGSFTINFKAIPDRSQAMWLSPVFTYTAMVDVTDISGETHSAKKTVSVSDKSLLIDLSVSGDINREKLKTITIKTTNLNGEKEATEVEVKISRLSVPERVLLERNWPAPDVYMISEEDFNQWFPNIPYKNEDDRNSWEELAAIHEETIDTGNDSILDIKGLSSWEAGVYRVVMSTEDVFGEEIEVIRFFTLYTAGSYDLPDNRASEFIPVKKTGEPGESAQFLVGSSFDDVNILYTLEDQEGIREHKWIKISNGQKLIEIPIKEEDRGGLGVNFVFISHNNSFEYSARIDVPFTNKELDITFGSFRDRLMPGQEEQWNIMIRSNKGEKVAAEMLAGMYDASLDAFVPHQWSFMLYHSRYFHSKWNASHAFTQNTGMNFHEYRQYDYPPARTYDHLDWKNKYGYASGYDNIRFKQMDGMPMTRSVMAQEVGGIVALESEAEEKDMSKGREDDETPPPTSEKQIKPDEFPVRKNLQETAFFFPQLRTNKDGDVIFSFTMPEALTRWKMMGLAYTRDLRYGMVTKELVTQKDLMIMPNQPRFFREGDEIWFSARVVNMSDGELSGMATLQLFDAASMSPIDSLFGHNDIDVEFTASKGSSALVSWKLSIPENSGPVLYRVMASSGKFSDGEEMIIPVLSNRMLVTESLPLPVNGNETRNFVFEKMASSSSNSLKNYRYTLEFTANPAWYAVQALPYLMEYPHECSEQIFNRVYANAFASYIVNKHPRIRTVFESWKAESPEAFLSNLEKNQDLKNALLIETPWVMQAKSESERKQRIAMLFDLNKMQHDLSTAISKLEKKQLGSGGWPWFDGGRDNRYITQYIISGLGRMAYLGILDRNDNSINKMLRDGIRYLDERIQEDFNRIKKEHEDYMTSEQLNRTHIQYLYARSFFMNEHELPDKHKEAFLYFREQAEKYWTHHNKYMQGMIALALHRLGKEPLPKVIVASIKEHALYDDEMGMYWRADAGYYWYEAPIETQALLIEAFDEVTADRASVELMKTWLLKQKQTHDWETTRATADACYALLLRGANLIAEEGDVEIRIGGESFDPDEMDGTDKEAGTGYFQYSWSGSDIEPDMANITVTKANEGVAWGAVYWQYFEDLDRITAHASPLSIKKKLFLKTLTEEGPVLSPVNDGDMLKPGDKLVSRIEISVDRDMEFVHMKDMRAAALEPENTLSGYRWQGGMGYYESIRDASVNFFFSYLRKGTWVFEYPLNVTQRGTFSNGISTIQCMYAPEFASHSEGVKIVVE